MEVYRSKSQQQQLYGEQQRRTRVDFKVQPTNVGENVCHNSKNVKSHVFFYLKNRKKR